MNHKCKKCKQRPVDKSWSLDYCLHCLVISDEEELEAQARTQISY